MQRWCILPLDEEWNHSRAEASNSFHKKAAFGNAGRSDKIFVGKNCFSAQRRRKPLSVRAFLWMGHFSLSLSHLLRRAWLVLVGASHFTAFGGDEDLVKRNVIPLKKVHFLRFNEFFGAYFLNWGRIFFHSLSLSLFGPEPRARLVPIGMAVSISRFFWTVASLFVIITVVALVDKTTSSSERLPRTRVVRTKYGHVQGRVYKIKSKMTSKLGIHLAAVDVFQGIRYATPPVGHNRFVTIKSFISWSQKVTTFRLLMLFRSKWKQPLFHLWL